jgi:lipid II:glycine glycyltransferase (peptidoglycan interpeptide bridge formation enzyme)
VCRSALWLTRFNGVTTYRFPGWDPDTPGHPNANERLHWEAIQSTRERGGHTYDFGGIPHDVAVHLLNGGDRDAADIDGPLRFKLGFGGSPVVFPGPRMLVTVPGITRAATPMVRRLLTSRRGHAALLKLRGSS